MIALFASLAIAGLALGMSGQFRSAAPPASLEELERAIGSGNADASTWQAYGDALERAKRFGHAAAAYQRALEIDPDRPAARFNAALALAQANVPDKFFTYCGQLTANDPKQAVDLLDRPEMGAMRQDSRWETAATAARAQAAD